MSAELFDAFRQKTRESVAFTEVNPRGFMDVRTDDQTWTTFAQGSCDPAQNTSPSSSVSSLSSITINLRMSGLRKPRLQRLFRMYCRSFLRGHGRLSLQLVAQPDPEHMHVKICLEASDPT
jgi:hypothetical protein